MARMRDHDGLPPPAGPPLLAAVALVVLPARLVKALALDEPDEETTERRRE